MESILNSTKKLIGIDLKDDFFDSDLIIYINTRFALLKRMGIGPAEGFSIEDKDNEWDEYMPEGFDPPTNSAVLQTLKEEIKELEWSLNFEIDAMADCKEG